MKSQLSLSALDLDKQKRQKTEVSCGRRVVSMHSFSFSFSSPLSSRLLVCRPSLVSFPRTLHAQAHSQVRPTNSLY